MTRQIENGMTIELEHGSMYRVVAVLENSDHVVIENKDTGKYRQLKKTDYHEINSINPNQ